MSIEQKLPSYKSLYRDIKDKIEKELYTVGMQLPTEKELQEEYSVSRTTVRRAIALLKEDGLITVKQGCGTEIVRKKVSQSLNSISSVSESLCRMGHEVGVASMHVERIDANYELAEKLQVSPGESLILISRIQTSDGVPITIAKNYIPEKLVPGIMDEKDKIVGLYKYLNDKYAINITRICDRIGACSATFDEAVALEIEPKSALIVVHRVCYMGGHPCEVDDVKIIASKYEYQNDFEKEGE